MAAACTALALSAAPPASAAPAPIPGSSPGQPSNVPYDLNGALPSGKTSPSTSASAPYTPAVMSLLAQLEPSQVPTKAQLTNADNLLHGGTNGTCYGTGPVAAPTGTTPSIAPLCWADAQGVHLTSGTNVNDTTAPTTLMNLGASFDTSLANVWGQTEGTEAREMMVTGIYGPQTDLDRTVNWGRNLTTTGEDPTLSSALVAAQINGMQGSGAMSQMKHFGVYDGQSDFPPGTSITVVQDQALHEQEMTPYEGGFVSGGAASTMCAYQIWQDTGAPSSSVSALTPGSSAGSTNNPQTWPLNEAHFSCEQPLSLTYLLRDMWGSQAFVGSDYPATHSTSAILQGEDQEMPSTNAFFSATDTLAANVQRGFGSQQVDVTGSTCADSTGFAESCSTAGAVHVGGIPNGFQGSSGSDCPNTYGCALVDSVLYGNLPLSVFNQSVARILYQEQRFGLLGCDQSPVASSCTNPGGIASDRTGTQTLPTGPANGATAASDLGTKNGDAAVVERMSEEGATLLKNSGKALPITASDLTGSGVLVTGAGAEYTVADPTSEAATGYLDRDAINPLQQLQAFSGKASAFTYVPANSASGEAVPSSALSTSATSVTGGLARTAGPGSPATDNTIDFTTTSAAGQLTPGNYTWTGYVYVPTTDTYTFRLQYSSAVPASDVTFSFDGTARSLSTPKAGYVTAGSTNGGYIQAGLTNTQYAAGSLIAGTYHAVTITFNNTTAANASLRFGYSRANGDIADAAAAAKGKKLAVVFVDDSGATTTIPNPYSSTPATISSPEQLAAADTNLIEAVAAANPNTVVVLNTTNPVLVEPWIGSVKGLLDMWFSGQEGGTSTARLLLGLADPSGHTPLTWPANATDTLWGYNQTKPLYPGDTTGPHLERLNGGPVQPATCTTDTCSPEAESLYTEGIYTGYKYYDQEGITPQYPFGYGLSYTSFSYSGLNLHVTGDGGANVSFAVTNTGSVTGTDVAQVYVGPPTSRPSGVQFAVRSLAQFKRVSLRPGQTKPVTLHVSARSLSYWSSARQRWILDAGGRAVYAGDADSVSSLPLRGTLQSQAGDQTCANQAINTTVINGNLTVPEGAWCDLVSVTIHGSLILQGAAGVRVQDSTITGGVTATGIKSAADPFSAGTNLMSGNTIGGSLDCSGSGVTGSGNRVHGRTSSCSSQLMLQ